jgi:hypothetical protein
MKARILAGAAAIALGSVPVLLPVGWSPLLATGAAALLATYAALGA